MGRKVLEEISSMLSKIEEVWNEIGVDEEKRSCIVKNATEKVLTIYCSLLEREEEEREKLKRNMIVLKKQIKKLCQQLATVEEGEWDEGTVPLQKRKERLCERVEQLERVKCERLEKLNNLHTTLHQLWRELVKPNNPFEASDSTQTNDSNNDNNKFDVEGRFSVPPSQSSSDLSEERVRQYEIAVEEACTEKEDRLEIMNDLFLQIQALEDLLDLDKENRFCFEKGSSLSWETIEQVKRVKRNLEELREERKERIEKYKQNILTLSLQLQLDASHASSFFLQHSLLSTQVMYAMEEEEKRLKKLFHLKLEKLLSSSWEIVSSKYSLLHTPPSHRLSPPDVTSISSFEEAQKLLSSLQQLISSLDEQIESSKPLFSLIEKRNQLRQYKLQLACAAADPNRLLSKKSHINLLQEEKLRSQVAKLPKVENELIEAIQQWQKTYARVFVYEGGEYLETILTERNQDALENMQQKEMRERAKADRLLQLSLPHQHSHSTLPHSSLPHNAPHNTTISSESLSSSSSNNNNTNTPSSSKKPSAHTSTPSSSSTVTVKTPARNANLASSASSSSKKAKKTTNTAPSNTATPAAVETKANKANRSLKTPSRGVEKKGGKENQTTVSSSTTTTPISLNRKEKQINKKPTKQTGTGKTVIADTSNLTSN